MRKLTNEVIDYRIKDRPILRIGGYTGSSTKILWRCTNDGYEWVANPKDIFRGSGCPKCAGNLKLSNEIIDDRLKGKTVQRIGDYVTTETPLLFRCLVDDHEWSTRIGDVTKSKVGACPRCAGNMRLSDAEIDSRITGRNIRRVGTCGGRNTIKIKWACLIDGYEWEAIPANVLNGAGCPKCGRNARLTNSSVDTALNGRSIIRFGDIERAHTKTKWKCLIDDYEWEATPGSVLNGTTGCPKCGGKLKLTNDEVDTRVAHRNIQRLGDYVTSETKIWWKCLESKCAHEWEARPDDIFIGTGCPLCKRKSERKVFEFLIKTYHKDNVKREVKVTTNNRWYLVDFSVHGIFVEYHGQQHYYPVEFFGGESQFKKQQKRDEELRQYCLENNIPLIEIRYDQPDKLNWLKNEIDSILNKEEKAA